MKTTATFLFSLLFVTLLSSAKAEDNPYELLLKSGNYTPEVTDFSKDLSALKSDAFNGKAYYLLQFYDIPTTADKQQLKNIGVETLEYLPHNAFITAIDESFDLKRLNRFGVRSVEAFSPQHKMSKELATGNYPDYAVSGKDIGLYVQFHNGLNKADMSPLLQQAGFLVTEEPTIGNYLSVIASIKKIDEVLALPYVSYVEVMPPAPTPDDRRGRTMHRSNAINNPHPMGYKYDGTGVSMAIADDGAIGPHIDLKGRVTQFTFVDGGTHGDMTTGIAMGGGNLNPIITGMASGSYLYYYDISGYPHISNAVSNLNSRGVVITSTSYSQGCNAGYTSDTRAADQQTRLNPALLHIFSAGNSASSTCGGNNYGAGTPWGTITGGIKQGKNTIATGNLDYRDLLTASSSRGPAADGRLKPDICANGTNQLSTNGPNTFQTGGGTSAAAPGIAGISAQLYHAYRDLNGGSDPESGLIKAAMLNTAEDLGRSGPDFFYGWGRVNALRALRVLENNTYLKDSISQGLVDSNQITIPAGVEQLKVMVYWMDFEGASNTNRALVNNLDMRLIQPNNTALLPWVLNSAPNASTLDDVAVRGIDNLNNVEQVTIENPTAGTYTIEVNGTAIPQGPQGYYIIWETRESDIEVTYPMGGESFVPGTTETIRWDAYGNTGNFAVDYSLDSGLNWTTITSSVSGALRYYNWAVPNSISANGDAMIRVRRGSDTGVSAHDFSIIPVPSNLRFNYICPDSIEFAWNTVAGATAYEVSRLGATHMDSIGTTTTNSMVLYNVPLQGEEWFSVKALGNGIIGRRAIAIQKPTNVINCPLPYDFEVNTINNPANSFLASCNSGSQRVTITVVNRGDSVLTNIPVMAYSPTDSIIDTVPGPLAKNQFAVFTFSDSISLSGNGTIDLIAKSLLNTDDNPFNDSIVMELDIAASIVISTFPYTYNLENLSTCPTTSNCEVTVCNLSSGWLNSTGDDIDWRTDIGGTPSNGTGPSVDHNPGTTLGRYLYTEASNGCIRNSAVLYSPCLDLTGLNNPKMSFWYHMSGSFMGDLRVHVISNDGNSLNNNVTPAIVGDQGTAWLNRSVDLSAYAGQVINVLFEGTTGNSWQSDIAIDDFMVYDSLITSIDENNLVGNNISLYPNPNQGQFILETAPNLVGMNYFIQDIQGKTIWEGQIRTVRDRLNLSELKKGVYFLTIPQSGDRQKLIIQ